jgi:HD-GYP domain-containing protein (c-di-GMP phosphodiesterase class II)
VRDISLMIYDVLPRPQRHKVNREQLGYAALLHDLGKIGIPEAILNKPGPLTDEERATVKAHPQIGVDIVRPIGLLDDATDWILYHHESMDGSGYFGKRGDEIPLGARIIAVADMFSALYMNRPYAGSVGYDECVRTMRDEAGTHLDEQLVEAFCSIPREDVLACALVAEQAPAAGSSAAPVFVGAYDEGGDHEAV